MRLTIVNIPITMTVYVLFAALIFVVLISFIVYSSVRPANGFINLMHRADDVAFKQVRHMTLMRTSSAIMQINDSLSAAPQEGGMHKQMASRTISGLIEGLRKVVEASPSKTVDDMIGALELAKEQLNQEPRVAMQMLRLLNQELTKTH